LFGLLLGNQLLESAWVSELQSLIMVKVELPKRVAENINQFTGRAWLLPKLLEWWDNTEERLFLLTGGPGTGKSMVLAWLAGSGPEPKDEPAREQLSRLRGAVKAAHFCQAASRNLSPQAFAENIVNQLTGAVRGFGDALAATLAERVQITAPQTVGGSVNHRRASSPAFY
jgi:hypothetical protein